MSKRELVKAMREALEAEGVKVVDFPISDELDGVRPSFVIVDDEGVADVDDVAGEAAKDDVIAVADCENGREVTVMLYAARMVSPRMMELVYEADRPISAYRCGDAIIVDECHIALDWSESVAEMKKPPRLRLDDGRKAWQTCHGPAIKGKRFSRGR